MKTHGSILTLQDRLDLSAKLKRVRAHAPAAAFLLALFMAFYYASLYIFPGWVTYTISIVALSIVGFTSLARLDDIDSEQASKRWQARRAGLLMVVAGAGMVALDPVADIAAGRPPTFPTWNQVMMHWGVALTWITTPHMPPWWRYITGQYKTLRGAKIAAVADSISGLDPDDDSTQYSQGELPSEVEVERRTGQDRRELGP